MLGLTGLITDHLVEDTGQGASDLPRHNQKFTGTTTVFPVLYWNSFKSNKL